MLDELWSQLDDNQKKGIIKGAAIFMGGVVVGYAIKKSLESPAIDNIKHNFNDLVTDYFNHQIEYVDEVEVIDNDLEE